MSTGINRGNRLQANTATKCFRLPDTIFSGANSKWARVFRVKMPVTTSIALDVVNGSGFNVGQYWQLGSQRIIMRTGNGSPAGINIKSYCDNNFERVISFCGWKAVSSDVYDIYFHFGSYPDCGQIYEVKISERAEIIDTSCIEVSTDKPSGITDGVMVTISNNASGWAG